MQTALAQAPVEEAPASPGPAARFPEPPRALVWMSGAVVLAGVAIAAIGAVRTGITWDEPYHLMRLRNFLDHGWYALDSAFIGGTPASDDTNTVVYAPVAMLLLHGLTVLTGQESWGAVSASTAAYDVRHLGVVAFGLAGTAAAAGITKVIMDSWRWALFTAAALLAFPMWTGHLMFNIKDVPVASGYTITTLALALIATAAPGQSRRERAPRTALLTLGALLMLGTRPAMISAIAIGVTLVIAASLGALGRPLRRGVREIATECAVGIGVAALALVALYPNVFAHPQFLVRSAEQSASFRDGTTAVLGYIPFFVAIQTPLLLLALVLIGLFTAIRFLLRSRSSDPTHALLILLVGAQLGALPLIAMVKGSDLYNGLRQLLFAAPAWAVFVALGMAAVLAWARERGRMRSVGALALAALALPTVDQAIQFPYGYTYYNPLWDATGINIPTDYWRASAPELIDKLPTDGQIVCGPTRSSTLGAVAGTAAAPERARTVMLAGRYTSDSSVDCRTDPLGPLATEWRERGLPLDDDLPPDQFYALIDRDHPLPANCSRLDAVTRQRHLRTVTMTYVARCRLAPPTLGTAPVPFQRADLGRNLEPRLWSFAPTGFVARNSRFAIDAASDLAALGFTTGPECAQGCQLVIDGTATPALSAAVNGKPAIVHVDLDTQIVTVDLPPASATGATRVEFTHPEGELVLRIRSIHVASPATPALGGPTLNPAGEDR